MDLKTVNIGAPHSNIHLHLWKNHFLPLYIKENTNVKTKELDFPAKNTKLIQTRKLAKIMKIFSTISRRGKFYI
jgi:hypothetical protein